MMPVRSGALDGLLGQVDQEDVVPVVDLVVAVSTHSRLADIGVGR
jgi:hypothetical protein